jgi:hypothetical protein
MQMAMILKPIRRVEYQINSTKGYYKPMPDGKGGTKKKFVQEPLPMPEAVYDLYPPGWGKQGVRFRFTKDKLEQIMENDVYYLGHKEKPGITYYFYIIKKNFYVSEIHLSNEEALLIVDHDQARKEEKLRREVERIKAKSEYEGAARTNIPQDVQITVWNRDKGKCVRCGSNENLEFDHIIPVSKGGSNTVRNLQLLCEKCNRLKSNKIGE